MSLNNLLSVNLRSYLPRVVNQEIDPQVTPWPPWSTEALLRHWRMQTSPLSMTLAFYRKFTGASMGSASLSHFYWDSLSMISVGAPYFWRSSRDLHILSLRSGMYIWNKGSIVGPAWKAPFVGPFLSSVYPKMDEYKAKFASGELSCVSVFHKYGLEMPYAVEIILSKASQIRGHRFVTRHGS